MSTSHVVKRGETLGSIAKANHIAVADLARWNDLKNSTITYGQWLTIPSPTELHDRKVQMGREKDEAKCDESPTERHVFQLKYDQYGRTNMPRDGIVVCEACGRYVRQEGARWVTVANPTVARFMQIPQLVIQEQDTIDELL